MQDIFKHVLLTAQIEHMSERMVLSDPILPSLAHGGQRARQRIQKELAASTGQRQLVSGRHTDGAVRGVV